MRALVDINVVLDVLADREPFAEAATMVFQLVENGVVEGCIAAHTITTLHHLLAKHSTKARTRAVLDDLLHLFQVVPWTKTGSDMLSRGRDSGRIPGDRQLVPGTR